MAGEFTGYYVYEDFGSNRRLKGMYGTQDTADTAAALDTELTANQGSVAFPNGIMIGWIWDTGTSAWRQEATSDLSDVDQVKAAAHQMLDVFETGIAEIVRNRQAWPQNLVEWAITGIHWQTVNSARIVLNSVRTTDFRQKWLEESASWPDITSPGPITYVDSFNSTSITEAPSGKFSWVNDMGDPPGRLETSAAYTMFDTTTNIEDAPSTAKLIGRGWVDDIPA